jgi:isoquinoline 1-oxidoreductase beta subunit
MSTVMKASKHRNALSRREFFATLRALSGLVLIAGLPGVIKAEETKKYGADAMAHGWTDDPLAFIVIGEDDVVTIVVHRREMGQGVRTGMPLTIADELEADWSKVRVVQASAGEAKFGNQDTDGSRSTRHFFEPMRRCGAAARTMLEQAAAARWGVPVSEVRAVNHEVVHSKSGRKLGYGTLAQAAARLPVPPRESLKLKDPTQFRYIGNVAFDCGPQVNPERIRAQLEGAAVMGVSVATLGEITFKNDRAEQTTSISTR